MLAAPLPYPLYPYPGMLCESLSPSLHRSMCGVIGGSLLWGRGGGAWPGGRRGKFRSNFWAHVFLSFLFLSYVVTVVLRINTPKAKRKKKCMFLVVTIECVSYP